MGAGKKHVRRGAVVMAASWAWLTPAAAQSLPTATRPAVNPSAAEGAVPGGVENVTVTAQKRRQKIQDVPISITVLDQKTLRRLDVRSSDELAQYVPSVQIGLPSGKGNQPLISIRGVGLNDTNTNNAGPNGVYVDEVYQASPAGQTFQTFDLSRVEVLKGPQGTLYGRNTTGGAINYVTNKPTDAFSASEDVQYGSFNTASTLTTVNGQLSPGIDARGAVFYNYSDGFFKDLTDHNTTNGANDLAYRGQLLVQTVPDLDLLFNFHGGNVNRRPDEYKQVGVFNGLFGATCADPQILAGQCTDLYGYKAPRGFYSGFYNRDQRLYINAIGGSARADYHLGDITLTSLTAFEMSHKEHPEDSDAEPHDLLQINYGVRSTDITQEFRATGGGTDYHWLAGLYYLSEHLNQDQSIDIVHDIDQVVGFPGLGNGIAEQARAVNGQFTESVATYGQGDYEVFPNARLTLGGRLTYEHKAFDADTLAAFETNGAFPAETPRYGLSENLANRAASWRAAFDYKIVPNILTYVSASTGFKSGGFNGGFLSNSIPEALAQLRPIKPEYITAVEAGVKSDFFNERLRFNAAVFNYTYHDLQIYNLIQSPVVATALVSPPPLPVLANAPRAFIRGAEFEFDAVPMEHLTASISLSFLNAKLGQFISGAGTPTAQNYTGNQLPNAPKFNAIFGGDYALPLARGDVVELSANASYRAHQFFESNNNPLVAQNGYWLLDARLSYTTPNKKWDVAVLGKNLTGTQYLNFSNDVTSQLGFLEEIVGPPRYVGGEVVYRY